MNRVERLHEIARKGLAWYGEDLKIRDFGHVRYFDYNYTEEQRMVIIKTLKEVYETIPIIQKEDGFGIDTDRWTKLQEDIVLYAYYDLPASVLRGTVAGSKIKPKAYPEVNRWNPLLIYVLSMKHGIPYEQFRPAKALFGRDLRNLCDKVKEGSKINVNSKYYIGSEGDIVKEENAETVIPNYSAWAYASMGKFPKTYHSIQSLYKMKEEHMIDLQKRSIIK